MTERKISSCKGKQVQKQRCEICTGCGRCRNADAAYCIVTESPLRRVRERIGLLKEEVVLVDVGTTTVAMQLLDKEGNVRDSFLKVNPQVKYGADVLSRILAAEDTEIAGEMRCLIREVIKEGLARFADKGAIPKQLKMVLVANTTMVYLLMGYNTAGLGKAPFTAEHLRGFWTDMEGIPCFVFPGVSAFVGGDIVAGSYAAGMFESEQCTLLIDLGTNGELMLGNRYKRMACSTAAGPAFEGGAGTGIWGADMISLTARLLREGFVDETGLLAEPYFDEGIRIGGVYITQQIIRNLQLAKAAIATGIALLVKQYAISMEQIDRVILAGGLGYYINPTDAVQIGLLPECLAGKTTTGGNTALAGASVLAYTGEYEFVEAATAGTRPISIARNEEFEELFLQNINFMKV